MLGTIRPPNYSNYIDLAISFVKSFRKIDYFIFGVNNTHQLKEIIKIFNLSNAKRLNLRLFINSIKQLKLGNKIDLRYW